MEFRPCIDIHNGRVKQIVGGSLRDKDNYAKENFVSGHPASYYASLYRADGLRGGHIILLNPKTSEFYEAGKAQALEALAAYPGGMQMGGGITPENAEEFLDAGASHVIVSSYVLSGGRIHYGNLERLCRETGKSRLVLDLSCRKKGGQYYIVTDRWQKFTEEAVTLQLLSRLADYADEFLVHGTDVEGLASGIETELVELLSGFGKIPVTYAGGIGSFDDLTAFWAHGRGRVHITVGSALDLFGGPMPYREVLGFFSAKRDNCSVEPGKGNCR